MIPDTKCPYGGRPTFQKYGKFVIDKETGIAGYRVGFVPKEYTEAGEPIIIPLNHIHEFRASFRMDEIRTKIKKPPVRVRVGKWLASEPVEAHSELKKVKIDGRWIWIK